MQSFTKPVILVLHGAWHRPLHYISFLNHFQNKGYTVRIPALATAGSGNTSANQSIEHDVSIVRQAISPFLEAGREIVVVCHSFGGFAGTASVVGETLEDRRARGKTGGIKAMVFIASFAPPAAGLSLFDMVGLKDPSNQPSWWAPRDDLACLDTTASEILYAGVEEEMTLLSMSSTVPQSLRSFQDPSPHGTSEVRAPKTYIVTTLDTCIPPEGQRAMAQAAGAKIIEMNCGHSPFLRPENASTVFQIIEEVALQSIA